MTRALNLAASAVVDSSGRATVYLRGPQYPGERHAIVWIGLFSTPTNAGPGTAAVYRNSPTVGNLIGSKTFASSGSLTGDGSDVLTSGDQLVVVFTRAAPSTPARVEVRGVIYP